MGWEDNTLVAYTRLIPPREAYQISAIGRVVTSQAVRGTGIGKMLIDKSIEELEKLFDKVPIKVGAQLYLREFYNSFGFKQSSDIYDEDGIDHIEMIRH
jgi:ElaA protein